MKNKSWCIPLDISNLDWFYPILQILIDSIFDINAFLDKGFSYTWKVCIINWAASTDGLFPISTFVGCYSWSGTWFAAFSGALSLCVQIHIYPVGFGAANQCIILLCFTSPTSSAVGSSDFFLTGLLLGCASGSNGLILVNKFNITCWQRVFNDWNVCLLSFQALRNLFLHCL